LIVLNLEGMETTDIPLWPFSGVALNWHALAKAHVDPGDGPLAVIVPIGDFKGGHVCLPTLKLTFELQPGEVLIFDSKMLPHFNLDPELGPGDARHSLVLYTQHRLSTWCAGNGWPDHQLGLVGKGRGRGRGRGGKARGRGGHWQSRRDQRKKSQ
jgi:hypothetical protein